MTAAKKTASKAGKKTLVRSEPKAQAGFLPRSQRALADYLEKVRVWHGYARFIGLPALIESSKDVPLRRLYVAPRLSESPIAPEAMNDNPPATQELVPALAKNQRLVVLGDPGSGKSTLVNYISEALARESMSELRRALKDDVIPLPFILRELGVSEKVTWDNLCDAFLARPVGLALGSTPETRRALFDQLMVSGQGWVLLDGLDEIGSVAVRKALRAAYDDATRRFFRARFLLTSRVIGYSEVPFHGVKIQIQFRKGWADAERSRRAVKVDSPLEVITATHSRRGVFTDDPRSTECLHLAPFNDEQVREFTQNWWMHHRANPALAAAEANDFLAALHAKHDTRTLGRVPNLLVLIALIYKVFVKLPDGRADLYAKIAEAYLENIDRHYHLKCPLPYSSQQMARWLARVAWEMQYRRHCDAIAADKDRKNTQKPASDILVTRDEARQWLAQAIREEEGKVEAESESLADTFLDFAARRSGLFVPRGEDSLHRDLYAFMHLSFQEYFCAVHLRDQVARMRWWRVNVSRNTDTSDTSLAALRGYAARAEWAEVFVFLFEMLKTGDPDRPLAMLRVLLGENEDGSDWQEFDAPFPLAPAATKANVLHPPRHASVRLVELAASLAMNSEVAMPPEARSGLLRRCWEWEIRRLTAGEGDWSQNSVTRVLAGRRTYSSESWSALTSLGPTITKLFLDGCTGLTSLDPLKAFGRLKTLSLGGCTALTSLEPLKSLGNLRLLSFTGCTGLTSLDPLKDLHSLQSLYLSGCTGLTSLDALKHLDSLQSLLLDECTGLTSLDPIKGLSSLKFLSLSGCTGLTSLDPLNGLESLQTLFLDACSGLTSLGPIKGLGNLQTLYLDDWATQSSLEMLKGLRSLQTLSLDRYKGLTSLNQLNGLGSLNSLSLNGCTGLTYLDLPKGLRSLQSLYLVGCTELTSIAPLKVLGSLKTLSLSGCMKLTSLSPLKGLSCLKTVNISGCTGLTEAEIRAFKAANSQCRVIGP